VTPVVNTVAKTMNPASRTNVDLIAHLQTGADGKTKQTEGKVGRAMYTECMLIPLRTVTVLVAATAVLGLASAAAQEDPRPSLDEARGLFYNGRYEAATAIALPYCTVEPVDLNACELATSARHFQIRPAA